MSRGSSAFCSFRDPDSGVRIEDACVYRHFTARGAEAFHAFVDTGLLEILVHRELVIPTEVLQSPPFGEQLADDVVLWTAHPRTPIVSYPYEWSFEMLKAAALTHLEIMQLSLEHQFMLKDATSFNVQFIGTRPVFVDVGSFEPYREGEPWAAYAQFCRMFLNPLLLQALTGVSPRAWLRGSLDGIRPDELLQLLPLTKRLRRPVLVHVLLQSLLNGSAAEIQAVAQQPRAGLPRRKLRKLVDGLSDIITNLRVSKRRSAWTDYNSQNTYDGATRAEKVGFVDRVLREFSPRIVWDLGANTGSYALLVARHAPWVVAIDRDDASLDTLYQRARREAPNVTPLLIDLLNPSPDQGWAQREQLGLEARGGAAFVLCLALVHHIAISGNVPFGRIAEWLAGICSGAVVEFVPKEDAMVRALLRWRSDIFDRYTKEAFESAVSTHFRITASKTLPNGRTLYALAR